VVAEAWTTHKASLGLVPLTYKGIPVVLSDYCPNSTVYFFNSDGPWKLVTTRAAWAKHDTWAPFAEQLVKAWETDKQAVNLPGVAS
jgi:hypothetical protein